MLFKIRHWSVYALCIKIDAFPLFHSKTFLKEKVPTVFRLLTLSAKEIDDIPIKKGLRTKVRTLQRRLIEHVEKMDVQGFHPQFTRFIQKPPVRPQDGTAIMLEALLFFEKFLGNRRNITRLKEEYLSKLYYPPQKEKLGIVNIRSVHRKRLLPTG